MWLNPLSWYCLRRQAVAVVGCFLGVYGLLLIVLFSKLMYQFSEFDLPLNLLLPSLVAQMSEMALLSSNVALFFGIIITLQGLNASHERVVMQSVGLGYGWHIRHALVVALPVVALMGWLAFVALPDGLVSSKTLQQQARGQLNINFDSNSLKSYGDNLMIAIEEKTAENRFAGLVMQIKHLGKSYTISARQAEYQKADGQRWLNLYQAQIVDHQSPALKMTSVEQLSFSLEPFFRKASFEITKDVRMQPTEALWQQDSEQSRGELLWRLSFVLSGVVLSLLAVLLVHYQPRQYKASRFLLPLLVMLGYSRCIELVKSNVESGQWSALVAYGSFYALVMAIIGLLWLWYDKPFRAAG